jgi:hypothetical protein
MDRLDELFETGQVCSVEQVQVGRVREARGQSGPEDAFGDYQPRAAFARAA